MRSKPHHSLFTRMIIILLLPALMLSACRAKNTPASPGSGKTAAVPSTASQAQATPIPPTAVPTPTETPEPLALRINGVGVSVAEYQAELSQLQEADKTLGKNLAADQQRQKVLDNLTDLALLA